MINVHEDYTEEMLEAAVAIAEWCATEYQEDFGTQLKNVLEVNPRCIPVAYTELGGENEYPVQVYADLVDCRYVTCVLGDDDVFYYVEETNLNQIYFDFHNGASFESFVFEFFEEDKPISESENLVKNTSEKFKEMYCIWCET